MTTYRWEKRYTRFKGDKSKRNEFIRRCFPEAQWITNPDDKLGSSSENVIVIDLAPKKKPLDILLEKTKKYELLIGRNGKPYGKNADIADKEAQEEIEMINMEKLEEERKLIEELQPQRAYVISRFPYYSEEREKYSSIFQKFLYLPFTKGTSTEVLLIYEKDAPTMEIDLKAYETLLFEHNCLRYESRYKLDEKLSEEEQELPRF